MKTNGFFWALSWAAIGSLSIVQGCGGDDDDDAATGGKGGTAGSGTGGSTGGSAGSGTGGTGKGGTAGKGGSTTGGSAGTSGAGGAGGDDVGGAGGEGGGGSDERTAACAAYCAEYYEQGCNTFDATNSYSDEAHCNGSCEAATWAIGTEGDAAGNSIHCRLTHAGLAGMSDQDTHCGHASATSTGNCN